MVEPFLELLALQGIVESHAHEVLGREARDAFELDGRGLAQAVADAQHAGIPQAHDVARIGFVDHGALLRHELHRASKRQRLAGARMQDVHAPQELARANAQKSDAVPMLWIHVRLNLEHEAREGGIVGGKDAASRDTRTRRWREIGEMVEEGIQSAIRHGAAEEHRRDLPTQEFLALERRTGRAQELHFVPNLGERVFADGFRQLGRIELDRVHAHALRTQAAVEK